MDEGPDEANCRVPAAIAGEAERLAGIALARKRLACP